MKKTRGFTLVELTIVIGIIALLLSVVLFAVFEAQKNGRDKKRVGDLATVEFALTAYKSANRDYPSHDSGVAISSGAIDSIVQSLTGNTVADPKRDDSDFGYYYDSSFKCSESGQTVIFAKAMEQSRNANYDTVCTASNPDTGQAGPDSYVVILD